jgi:hypothetical protein
MLFLTICAGMPTAIELSGIVFVTNECIPTIEPLPIVTPFNIVTSSASHT